MQQTLEIIKADSRGSADHGWLKAKHTFSFADYYDSKRVHFGVLRVLNDDIIAPYKGFGTHPHQNMEIITIPLKGELEHEDSTGMKGIVRPNEVQVMSAGKGVYHSEKNPAGVPLNLFQIWIFPNKKDVEPRYDQKKFDEAESIDINQLLISPDGRNKSLWIYQDAFISRRISSGTHPFSYEKFIGSNGVFAMVVEGEAMINGEKLSKRDAIMVGNDLDISPSKGLHILFIEVPINN
ncbi:MAG: pirin family protein [Bacteroidales bacterium]|nr:pirin family protein [Bacteroidales bacterium]